ncbi:M48 family metallopeptidase [Vibrio rotiferianus]|uniref:Putative beta-barrel assembly-enhancing protease n=1 Tax=Vibrio rotiferianus TaxID=190895 RepID=A0A7Y3Z772_9VIBR|nr:MULTISPECIES: M48 family metallopeptidase [Vibrio]NOH47310.1 M48 family metallopeptidase [Vibrio rotiferianus]USD49292.1 M48 family metallopeptidase [Vibrio sp. SCSIO 43153]CAH1570792.1 beta-barrel assembly-enhancing protease [Vibrio rotiferianus]
MLKRTRSLVCLCLAAALSTPTPIYANSLDLPDIGTAAGGTLTIDQELIYGDAYMRMLRASSPIVSDPVINEYIDTLGHRLVANANDVKTPFHFFMIRDRNINAFAFFGGYVALHSGLFLHARTESELASVVAHEIAHVTQRHLARSMEEQARRSPATLAALAGALLIAIAAPEAGMAAITAATAGNMQSQINYTRSNEKEADRFGISTLAKAGFDVQAMPRFFGRLADEYRYASKPPPMLLTHPLPEDRITDSRARAQAYPPMRVMPSLDYHLTRARIVARHAGIDGEAAMGWFERTQKKATADLIPTFEYGKALVHLDNKRLDKAEVLLNKLLKQDPSNPFYLDAMTDLYIAQKHPEKAIDMLSKALKRSPHNKVLTINYANALLEAGKDKEAIKILQRYTHDNPEDTNGWHLLSKGNIALGNSDEDLASRAEILALRANWNKAIQYYSEASKIAELGSLKQARYDARIDQLMIQRDRFMALQ